MSRTKLCTIQHEMGFIVERGSKVFIYTIVAALIISINNVFFYVILKNSLESNHQREVASIATQIKESIEQSRIGATLYEDMIGEKLRSAAIAAESALPSRIIDVSNSQLESLRDLLLVDHISLMKRTTDNIIIQKATDPKEINLEAKTWGLWYKAFNQLFDNHNVTKGWGQSLPNFWSGPYEVASNDKKTIYKWGYYYDGKTDYIISPYVNDEKFRVYQQTTGIDAIINNVLSAYPTLNEITGINPATFEKTIKAAPKDKHIELVYRPYFFGTYTYNNEDQDIAYVNEAVKTKKTTVYRADIKDKHIEKTFIPISTDRMSDAIGLDPNDGNDRFQDTYILCIVTDYKLIESKLQKQFFTLLSIVIIVSIGCFILLFFVIRRLNRSKDKVIQQTSEIYTEEVNQMFLNIRGQRHDFLNQVNVIYGLVKMKKFDQLQSYTHNLIGEIESVNDIIQIDQPEIAALIQAKLVTAIQRKIQFTHDFPSLGHIMTSSKTADLVRMFGNLIDNAFEEVHTLEPEEHWVSCKGWIDGNRFYFLITNPINRSLTSTEQAQIFNSGFTTKVGMHSGLGLAITQSLLNNYKGEITVETENHTITFQISIPIN
ncbi:GHKL domain-containing protein [Paenibacillus psychroresistens]|uniref:GHKL domain-containing protein n=1 Tax=Paenibacillus psychroresistens TaxID=1778678 RepID=A0A6B8RQ08_9BACL|nr:GHKL domain-containing protein [Paenibacillus psychroresistens]QGQ97782.1 GHKL domain-containing protein [Paenibacillus psychroresistens]